MLVAFLLYVSKLILVPNLLIAQDMTLKEAVKESWNKVQGNTFLHVFLLLILMGIVSYLINLISVKYVAPAIITGTKWSFIWYSVVNSLMVQVVFVYFIGCIAHTYNSLYPLEIKTDPFAKASKYSRKTHPKYFQPLNKEQPNATEQQYYAVTQQTGHLGLQQQQNTPDQEVAGFNAPNSDPFLSPNEKPETPAQPKIPKPYKPQNVQENTQPAKTNAQNNEGSKKDDGPASKQKIQYISQKPEKPAVQNTPEPQSDKYIPVSENELVPQQEKPADQKTQKSQPEKYITVSENELVPQQEKAHVTKFVDNLFEKEDYPVGKIVPVDAMRMMRDSDVKFIEVQFQNAKHAMNTMKMLPIFINVPDSTEYKIREPLSYSLTLPKIPSNPVKLFFGGKDMTIKELWTCKEIILQNKGNIVRINRGKDE